MSTTTGAKIRALRKARGYTLEQLAEHARLEQELHLGAGEQGAAATIGGAACADRNGLGGND